MQSVQSYCFSLSNMQICDVVVAVVLVVTKLSNVARAGAHLMSSRLGLSLTYVHCHFDPPCMCSNKNQDLLD